MTTAREIMTGGVQCIGENETLVEAARKLRDLDIGSMPICGQDNRLKGMLTDRDIVVACIAEGGDPTTMTAGELARGKPVTIGADDDVNEALAAMKEHKIRRLPVIDGHDLVGMLTQADVARSLSESSVGDLVEQISEPGTARTEPSTATSAQTARATNGEAPDVGTLIRLSDTNETVADAAGDIRNRDVKDKDGADLGKVSDLLVDGTERKVRFIEVASGGFLGIGREKTYIPVDAITGITADEVRIDQTLSHVAGAPPYDPDLVRERDTHGSILDYYGYSPYWGPDYRYPDYPAYHH